MKKRALSPVIATVLLIGIVVVSIAIIWVFFRSLTQEAITKFGGQNVELVCNDVVFRAEYVGGEILISNVGNVPIADMKVKEYADSGYSTLDLEDFAINPLNSGQSGSYSFDSDGLTKIILIPVLKGNSNSGQVNFVCDEGNGYEIEF